MSRRDFDINAAVGCAECGAKREQACRVKTTGARRTPHVARMSAFEYHEKRLARAKASRLYDMQEEGPGVLAQA